MATKTQAKAAIDGAVTTAKGDIDNILPAGVNIIDGKIAFNPTKETIQLDAGGSLATATSQRDAIQTNLTAAGRAWTTQSILGRRSGDSQKVIAITTVLVDYLITNF